MNKLDSFILDIVSNDWESLEVITAELNNKPKRESSIYVNNNDYYLAKNNGKEFKIEDVKNALWSLLEKKLINARRYDPESTELKEVKVEKIEDIEWKNDWFKIVKR